MQAFMAGATDKYRKPNILMWEKFVKEYNGGLEPKEAMYIGDAAGRKKDWKTGAKKDFSCDDRKYAYNIGIKVILNIKK
jgi:bifunctional polynucleotide phosphatase/kinase